MVPVDSARQNMELYTPKQMSTDIGTGDKEKHKKRRRYKTRYTFYSSIILFSFISLISLEEMNMSRRVLEHIEI